MIDDFGEYRGPLAGADQASGRLGDLGGQLGRALRHTPRQTPAEDLLDTIAQLNARLQLARDAGWKVELALEAPPAPAHYLTRTPTSPAREPQLTATLTRKV